MNKNTKYGMGLANWLKPKLVLTTKYSCSVFSQKMTAKINWNIKDL